MMGPASEQVLIVSNVEDSELMRVRHALSRARYRLAAGCDDIRSLLAELAANPAPAPAGRRLDLVGHSVEHCFLRIGQWTLDGNAPAYFRDTLKPQLLALQITQVRLLGCSTATTDLSWKVITGIDDSLGGRAEVFGTRRLIDEGDYNEHGFVSVDALAGSRSVLPTLMRHPETLDQPRSIWVGNGTATSLAALRTAEHTCYAASAACAARRLAAPAV